MKIGFRLARAACVAVGVAVSGMVLPGESSAQTQTYSYDALGRLINVTQSGGSASTYSYDLAGNRTQLVKEQQAAAADYTPDAFNDFVDQNAVTNDPTIWFGPAQTVAGINRPITLRVERYNYSGNFSSISVNVYRDSGAGWIHQGSFDPRTAGYQYLDVTVNSGDKIHYAVDARSSEGRRTGSMNMALWNLSEPAGAALLSNRTVNMTVDNDNNYNIADYTLDPISIPTLSAVSNDSAAWTNTGTLTLTGINRPVTLRFTRGNQWDSSAAGSTLTRRLHVFHSTNNGASWAEYTLSSVAGAVVDVTVNNGDLIHTRALFETTTGRGESSFTGYITNLQTSAQISSFNVSGIVDADNNFNVIDTTPNQFSLGGPTTATASTWAVSSVATIAGINASSPISVAGGQYRINGGAWVTNSGSVSVGQTVQARVMAYPYTGGTSAVTVTIGGVSSSFVVTAVCTGSNCPEEP